MDFSDEDIAEYEEQLEDTDLKALLVAQTAELKEIRYQLQVLNQGLRDTSERSGETVVEYECVHCGAMIPEDERRQHAESQHNAPTDMALGSIYEST